jgi:hypothetical protein
VAKAESRLSKLIDFSQRLVAESSATDAGEIAEALDGEINDLCVELGITSSGSERYRALCVILLAEIGGLPEVQLDDPEKRGGGAPVVWNLKRHASLVSFVDAQACHRQIAIGRARDKFSIELSDPALADGTVRAEYYRAKRVFASVPRIAFAMMFIDANTNEHGRAFADFIKDGAAALTSYGKQSISATHIGKVKLTPEAPTDIPVSS